MQNQMRFNKLSENVEAVVLIKSKILCGEKIQYNSFAIFNLSKEDAMFIEAYLKKVEFLNRYNYLVNHMRELVIDVQNKIKNNKQLVNENELIVKYVLYTTYKKNKYDTIMKNNPKIMDSINKKIKKKKDLDDNEKFVFDYMLDIQQSTAEDIVLRG